jgi:4-carboxymuconolactone decarboxylase
MKHLFITSCMALLLMSCNTKENKTMTKIFPKGEKATEYFTGDAWVEMLTTDTKNFDVMSYVVTFAPGSRNYWHSHPGGQILYCISGEGLLQQKGEPVQHLKAGDVAEIKSDVTHWHGATPDKEFVHIGLSTQLSKGPTNWYGAVTDEEYNSTK